MTNQNPAVPAPGSPQERRQRDLLSKVNAHADRSLDRLFADIEELLSGDLEADSSSAIERAQHKTTDPTHRYPAAQSPQSDSQYYPYPGSFTSTAPSFSDDSTIDDAPPTAAPKPKKSIPIWLMAVSGIGITAIAAGSLLFWLVNERKIDMPNIDTSWLPFQSQQVSPADAQFADYMRKSIAKIEATAQAPVALAPAANIPNPALTTPAVNPTITTTPSTIVTAPISASPTAVTTPIALVKTLEKNNRPGAIFQIDGQSQTIRVGQQIGTSKWSLIAVAKGEVTIKQKGGQIRSVDVGQKF